MNQFGLLSIDEIIESKINDGIGNLIFELDKKINHFDGESDYDLNLLKMARRGILSHAPIENLLWVCLRIVKTPDEDRQEYHKLLIEILDKIDNRLKGDFK